MKTIQWLAALILTAVLSMCCGKVSAQFTPAGTSDQIVFFAGPGIGNPIMKIPITEGVGGGDSPPQLTMTLMNPIVIDVLEDSSGTISDQLKIDTLKFTFTDYPTPETPGGMPENKTVLSIRFQSDKETTKVGKVSDIVSFYSDGKKQPGGKVLREGGPESFQFFLLPPHLLKIQLMENGVNLPSDALTISALHGTFTSDPAMFVTSSTDHQVMEQGFTKGPNGLFSVQLFSDGDPGSVPEPSARVVLPVGILLIGMLSLGRISARRRQSQLRKFAP